MESFLVMVYRLRVVLFSIIVFFLQISTIQAMKAECFTFVGFGHGKNA